MEKNKDLFGEDLPTIYFKESRSKDDDGWMMCDAGTSSFDNQTWVVTTNHLKSDEIPDECCDAKTFCELVAKLLNEYYNKKK